MFRLKYRLHEPHTLYSLLGIQIIKSVVFFPHNLHNSMDH
uniref:Uncharacterized protein n=1 Tax=Arundo donax TaxID=35708 RepID=A0A0A8YR71_ARUDO